MNEQGQYEKNDVVLIEGGGSDFEGRAGRVVWQTEGLVSINFVVPATGEIVRANYLADAVSLVISVGVPHETTLLLERCCSVCHKLNWDNQSGGYNETHLNPDTGLQVKCDEVGKLYVDGDLVPAEES